MRRKTRVGERFSSVSVGAPVHRDLKPDNILLLGQMSQAGGEDFVKILDFGIALAGDQRGGPEVKTAPDGVALTDDAAELSLQRRFTVPGMVMGTPAYMSPEQAQGETLDGRSDQYALGCVLYEMLSGAVPFNDRRNVAKILMDHISARVVPLTERVPECPPSLDQLVRQLLAKTPRERFPSMAEVGQALTFELRGMSQRTDGEPEATALAVRSPVRRPPLWSFSTPPLWLLVLLAGVMLGVVGYLGYRELRPTADYAQMARELVELRQRAVSELKAQLKLPSGDLRLRAITSLGQTHEAALRPLLETLLQDPDAAVASRAAESLGLLGDRSARPALRLIAAATGSAAVRVAAAAALEQLGDTLGQKLLHGQLVGNDEEARLRAALVLCSASEVEAQAALRSWLSRGNPPDELVLSTLYRLASAGDATAHSQLLARLGRDARPEVRLSAAASLAKLGDDQGRYVLLEAARRPDQEQVLAARMLASVDGSADLELFRRILSNPQASVAALIAASEGLAAAGQSDDARALASLLLHSDARLRRAAASAIIELTGRDPAALTEQSLAWAEGALTDSNLLIRSSAVAALGDASNRAVPLLKRALTDDSEPVVRRAAARALARRHERDALAALRLGLADTDAEVRIETLRAIDRLGQRLQKLGDSRVQHEVKTWLTPLLASKSREEQVLASGTLYRLGDQSQRARLTAWLTWPEPAMRRAALAELARDRELLVVVMHDSAAGVRLVAASKLAELGDTRAVPVLTQAVTSGGLDGLMAYALLRKLGVVIGAPRDSTQLRFSGDLATRRAALEALVPLPLAELLPVLLAAARDGAAELRVRAAELAAELPLGPDHLPGGLAVLRALLYDNAAAVRVRAAALLSRLLRPIAERELAASTKAPRPARPAGGAHPGSPESSRAPEGGAALDAGSPSDGGVPADGGAAADGGANPDGGTAEPAPAEAARPAEPSKLPDLIADQYLAGGVEALEHKDYKKAQKLLERASSLCAKKNKRSKECVQLGPEIAYRLGSTYEAQDQLASAAAEYQKLEQLTRGKSAGAVAAQARAAMARLSARLGRIEISKLTAGRCVHGTLWMEPGLHRITLGSGQSTTVKVEANQTVELKTCSVGTQGRRRPFAFAVGR